MMAMTSAGSISGGLNRVDEVTGCTWNERVGERSHHLGWPRVSMDTARGLDTSPLRMPVC